MSKTGEPLPARRPSRAMRTRLAHRQWLTAHFVLLLLGSGGLFLANRHLSPETLWAHWATLAWGALFSIHLAAFSRTTLATMGGKRS